MRPRFDAAVAALSAAAVAPLAALGRGGADARALALLRMGTAGLVLFDLLDRLRDFHAFYTAAGLVPPAPVGAHLSLLALVDDPRFSLIIFLVGLGAALLALVGLFSRAALIALFVTLLSIQHRNPYLQDGGDAVLIALLFWQLFCDSAARWSLDAWRARRGAAGARPLPALVPAAPVRVLQLQIAAIYFFAFVTKTGGTWRDGSAVAHVLAASDWARGLGSWLAQHPDLCRLLTVATLVIEAAFAPLVFLPVRGLRWLGLGLGLALHLGIFFTMRLGVFPLVMPLSYLGFLAAPARPPAAAGAAPPTARPLALGLLALLGLVLAGQLATLTARRLPRALSAPLEVLGLRQDWRMFAPNAPLLDVRFTAPGRFADGSRADLVAGALSGLGQHHGFGYSRWHRLRNALIAQPAPLLAALGRFTCRRVPGLVEFELWAHVTPVLPGTAPARSAPELRLRQACTPPAAVSGSE